MSVRMWIVRSVGSKFFDDEGSGGARRVKKG
jgi:hypothetical protein